MSKVPETGKVGDFTLHKMIKTLNGSVSFGSPNDGRVNIQGSWATFTTPGVADTEFEVTHNLGYIPSGWLELSRDIHCQLKKGATPWTDKKIYLKCDQATATITIFVL